MEVKFDVRKKIRYGVEGEVKLLEKKNKYSRFYPYYLLFDGLVIPEQIGKIERRNEAGLHYFWSRESATTRIEVRPGVNYIGTLRRSEIDRRITKIALSLPDWRKIDLEVEGFFYPKGWKISGIYKRGKELITTCYRDPENFFDYLELKEFKLDSLTEKLKDYFDFQFFPEKGECYFNYEFFRMRVVGRYKLHLEKCIVDDLVLPIVGELKKLCKFEESSNEFTFSFGRERVEEIVDLMRRFVFVYRLGG